MKWVRKGMERINFDLKRLTNLLLNKIPKTFQAGAQRFKKRHFLVPSPFAWCKRSPRAWLGKAPTGCWSSSRLHSRKTSSYEAHSQDKIFVSNLQTCLWPQLASNETFRNLSGCALKIMCAWTSITHLPQLNPLITKRYICTYLHLNFSFRKQMFQGANIDLFKSLVPKVQNSECQNSKYNISFTN